MTGHQKFRQTASTYKYYFKQILNTFSTILKFQGLLWMVYHVLNKESIPLIDFDLKDVV